MLQRLEALEAECIPLEAKYREMQELAQVQKKTRPTVAEACSCWSRLTELWGEATEEVREELLQALVVRVEMREKSKGACQVAVLPQAPSGWLELNSNMGAGVGFEPTTFGL